MSLCSFKKNLMSGLKKVKRSNFCYSFYIIQFQALTTLSPARTADSPTSLGGPSSGGQRLDQSLIYSFTGPVQLENKKKIVKKHHRNAHRPRFFFSKYMASSKAGFNNSSNFIFIIIRIIGRSSGGQL